MQHLDPTYHEHHRDPLLRATLVLFALGAAALALEWQHAHTRAQGSDGKPKHYHRTEHSSSAAPSFNPEP